MNEVAAKEWLTKAWHHYSSAALLYQVHHYTDVIAVDLHYAVEITLKSILAYEIKKVLAFADQLLDRVCMLLNISTHEIKSEPN